VLRTVNPNTTLWEAILPECCLGLPAGLAGVDALLDDVRFFEPFRAFFDPSIGRPSIPMETYLRMMFLRFRYRLGFEALCREVTDSPAWRRFCRIPLGEAVPHPTTLMKITSRCGATAVAALNEALLAKAHENKVIKTDRLRADTTVVEANVAYPTDSGLLAKGVAKMVATIAKLKDLGLAARTKSRNRTRSVRRRAHDIGAWLRRRNDEAKDEVWAITAELAAIAEASVAEARHVAANATRSLRRRGEGASGKAVRLVAELERTAARVEQTAAQTRLRLSGQTPDGSTRVVSLHDADARPIAKGRLGKPVEFGYKAQVADNVDGVVLDYLVVKGNPPDAPMLVPAVERIRARFGRAPKAVTADRGYGEASVDAGLEGPRREARCHPSQRPSRCRPPEGAAGTGVHQTRQVAHWIRGADLLSQTRLRLAAHAPRRHWGSRDLVRLGRAGPQLRQGLHPHRSHRDQAHRRWTSTAPTGWRGAIQ